ncbi:hypothetical protein WMY93_032909 [Mugilogobius chulae]|uniref:ATP-dependent rRNA helicase SPB4-like C-terminal extension domain-containing protein n=1 Tax=Mugilogobius chulae TaxID=88201 RepID=A0AAW0MIE1_9GOBI
MELGNYMFKTSKIVNPLKLQSVQQKLESFLAQEKEMKERAQRCFVSYLRSVHLMKNKQVFDVSALNLQEYAASLGLAVAPRVRFLQHKTSGQSEETSEEEEEQLREFKQQLHQDDAESDSSSEDEEDLKDLDLLTVKRKDVFKLKEGQDEDEEEEEESRKKKQSKETKFKEAKKVLKRNFQVNTKVTFSEEGEAVQLWPPVQRAANANQEDEDDEEISGIDVEKARERLKLEDQAFDKEEYRRKVKQKHREQKLKAKAAKKKNKPDEEKKEEEDEVVAYLANSSEDEFDPDTLPDPDKPRESQSEEEEEEEEEEDRTKAEKRQISSDSESEEEEEEKPVFKRKKRKQEDEEEEDEALNTGLSLAEDEELVLHLLSGRSDRLLGPGAAPSSRSVASLTDRNFGFEETLCDLSSDLSTQYCAAHKHLLSLHSQTLLSP